MSGERIEFPLLSKGDYVGFLVVGLIFGSASVAMLLDGNALVALFIAIFFGVFFAVFFGPAFRLAGSRVVISEDRLTLMSRDREVWSIPWRHVKSASRPQRIGVLSRYVFEVAGHDGPVVLPFMAGSDRSEQLKAAIAARLPSGVQVSTKVVGLHPSRARYLAIGIPSTLVGVAAIWFSLIGVQPGQSLALFRIAVWVGLAGTGFAAVGVVKLIGWICWKPSLAGDRLVPVDVGGDTLWAAFSLSQQGWLANSTQAYAYAESHRSFDLVKQRRIGWLALGGIALLFLGGLVTVVIGGPKDGEPVPILMLGLICAIMLGFFTWINAAWSQGLGRILDHRDVVVFFTPSGLFLKQGDKMVPAKVVIPPRRHPHIRDSSGLNSASMAVEVDGERLWLDPISLTKVQDH
jgi:hypothetical protein